MAALTAAERQARSRAHKRGDHSRCDPARCTDVTPVVTTVTAPAVTDSVTDPVLDELGARGRRFYQEFLDEQSKLGPRERAVLEEAARTLDRLDTLDRLLRGDETIWARIEHFREGRYELVVDKTLAEARQQQTTFARLVSELRQSLAAPGDAKPTAPPVPAPPVGGSKIADLTARIARRASPSA